MPPPKTNQLPQPAGWSKHEADDALRRLLDVTIGHERAVALRNGEVAAVQQRHAAVIARCLAEATALETELEQYFVAQRKTLCAEDESSVQLKYGRMGIHGAAVPALAPLNKQWTWEKIARKLKRDFKQQFFHKPNPPGIDKVKVKKELSAAQLAACGMKLQTSEHFFIELNRLEDAA